MRNIKKHLTLFALDIFYFVLSVLMFINVPGYWYIWLSMITVSIVIGMMIILRPKAVDIFVDWIKTPPSMKIGQSMYWLGVSYSREPRVECNIGDKVIIHPVPGHSQATKAYPGVVRAKQIKGQDGPFAKGIIWVLVVEGIEDNKEWKGAWMNSYLFGRLEFVSRNYKED